MAEIIRMPRMSDTMEEGNIVGWLKKVGDQVEPGDVLAEVETDKATMELESYQEGTLLYIGVQEGTIPVNGILAVIGEKGEDYSEALAQAQKESTGPSSNGKEVEETNIPTPQPELTSVQETGPSSGSRIKASPLAKSIAAEAGVSLEGIVGSGDHGRIVKKDIESFLQATPQRSSEKVITRSVNPDVTYGDVPVSQMRKVIARRLGESKFGAPHFYLTIEINMGRAFSTRKDINALGEAKISFNDFVVKASAMALRKHPMVNASWHGDKITIHKDINIGVAVAVDEGLLVPVINNADYKSFSEINEEVKELAGRAKDKKLQPEEMQGNTFTISNLGMFGIEEFTAIINPPDACILAVGAIIDKAIVVNGEIKPGKMMKVTLSCDHRVVDGAKGAMFLASLKANLENPVNMLV